MKDWSLKSAGVSWRGGGGDRVRLSVRPSRSSRWMRASEGAAWKSHGVYYPGCHPSTEQE